MKNIPEIAVQIPEILLPKAGIDLQKWAVIAVDQFTSEPEYWAQVEQIVGDAPSTLRLVLPEIYLEHPDVDQRVQEIQKTMQRYLADGLFEPHQGLIYVERSVAGKTRRGIMLALDLEQYDYSKGSSSLIRATEGTIIERLPPRMKIRRGAALELPHILVLIDDPQRTVIEPISELKESLPKLYDFELMLDGGVIRGFSINNPNLENTIIHSLQRLANPRVFREKYGLDSDKPVLLFAMGDGNHSLATAKAVWEELKPKVGLNHPARYALVEVENVHDEGLEFKPIHRILFGLNEDIYHAMEEEFGTNYVYQPVDNVQEMMQIVEAGEKHGHVVGVVGGGKEVGVVRIFNPSSNLAVGTIQAFLDKFLQHGGAKKIDYVHGEDIVLKVGMQTGNAGIYLPSMTKSDLFKTVILDGVLPRKTFSMGEAREKRYYMEARRI
ncbi:MAG: DUF1015 domain-containing protein [Anaerolineales bacterium]